MRYLYESKVIGVNPMEMILREFGKRKWSGIIRAFPNENPTPALEFLRIEPAYSGTFGEHAQASWTCTSAPASGSCPTDWC